MHRVYNAGEEVVDESGVRVGMCVVEVGCCGSEVHQHTADVTSDAVGIGVAFVEGSVYFLLECVPVVVIGYVRVGLVCDDVSFSFLQGD